MGETVCNLGSAGIRRRAVAGAAAFVVGIAAFVGTRALGLSWAWRAWLLPLFVFAALGLRQARAGVCVALAAKGERETPQGSVEPVPDPALAAALRARSRRIWIEALALGTALTIGLELLSSRG